VKYRLVVTTNGRPGVLDRMLESFHHRVRPRPSEVLIVDDSGDEHYVRYLMQLAGTHPGWSVAWHPHVQGFCATVRDAWKAAAEGHLDWVYWSEDDFVYERGVELGDLAAVMEHEASIAQMAMMRQPVNETEIAAGSLLVAYRDRYQDQGSGSRRWLRSRTNFSTGSSLIRRRFMVERPWPDYPAECEGRYSLDLLAAGYEFGVWGAGEPWVRHEGVRSGTGY
jgi:Cu/Zn superoxide dismutase